MGPSFAGTVKVSPRALTTKRLPSGEAFTLAMSFETLTRAVRDVTKSSLTTIGRRRGSPFLMSNAQM